MGEGDADERATRGPFIVRDASFVHSPGDLKREIRETTRHAPAYRLTAQSARMRARQKE